jgi:hypothetical protein
MTLVNMHCGFSYVHHARSCLFPCGVGCDLGGVYLNEGGRTNRVLPPDFTLYDKPATGSLHLEPLKWWPF